MGWDRQTDWVTNDSKSLSCFRNWRKISRIKISITRALSTLSFLVSSETFFLVLFIWHKCSNQVVQNSTLKWCLSILRSDFSEVRVTSPAFIMLSQLPLVGSSDLPGNTPYLVLLLVLVQPFNCTNNVMSSAFWPMISIVMSVTIEKFMHKACRLIDVTFGYGCCFESILFFFLQKDTP